MRKRKRFFVYLGILVFTFVTLSACSSNNSSTGNVGDEAAPAESQVPGDPLGGYDPPVSLSAVRYVGEEVKFPEGDDIKDNIWNDLYRELGIDITYDWIVTGKEQYDSKLNISIASNNLPEFMEVNAAQLRQLADAGQLVDLTAAYESYASEDLKNIMDLAENALSSATFDGKLLAIPSTQPRIGGSAPLLWIRADWMDKLGLEAPGSIEDVVKIAEAFVQNDPDGNGQADTYGLAISENVGVSGDTIGFFNAFGGYPQIWVTDDSGQLQYGSIQPEMKPALAKLQEMYKNKLIDPEFGVKDTVKMFESITSSKVGMVIGPSWYPAWPFWDMVKEDETIDWASYPIPSVDGGEAVVQMPFSVSHYYVLKKGYSHPELIVKLANLYVEKLYSSNAEFDTYGTIMNGDEAIGVNKYSLVEVVNPNKDLIRQEELETALASGSDAEISSSETKIMFKEFQSYLNGTFPAGWAGYKSNGPESSMKQLRQLNDAGKVLSNGFVGAPTESMAEKKATLDRLELETFTKIIIGEQPVEQFDKFVQDWKKLGGDDITKEVNE